jgi:cobalt-zinc-cadmium efflux system outer membrane protein
VRALRAGTDIARADVLAAARWPNPRVTFDRESVAGVTETRVLLTQLLPITGRRPLQVRAASALVDASTSRADDQVRQARTELRVAYADLVAAQQREAEFLRARDRLNELAGVIARRESAGEAAGYDRLRAEREVTDLQSDMAAARADRMRAQATLGAFFTDVADATTLVAHEPEVAARPPLPAVAQLLQSAETARGEFAALQHEIESARFAELAAVRSRLPEPEVIAGTKSSTVAGGDTGGVIGVQASIPLFDRAAPERAVARARLSQAEARSAAFRIALRAQITALRALVEERRQAADHYRATSIAGATQLERIAQVSYDAGERGILELLDAFRSGASARTRLALLDASVRQAEIELEFVSGWGMK